MTAASSFAAAIAAQQLRAEAPLGAVVPVAPSSTAATGNLDDPGVTVDMFENLNLDRYLRRAQAQLERDNFPIAIQLLQDVIEGKTNVVDIGGGEEGAAGAPTPPPETPEKPAPGKNEQLRQAQERRSTPDKGGAGDKQKQPELDARNSVFSQDGRLYRPVRRLCHELLARMPAAGLDLYRANHEVAAEELLQQALADGSLLSLEQVANRYFVTLPAGRAMALLADRLMHEGRPRAAVLVLNDLLETYPAEHRKKLGISEVWCRFKIALCLRLVGESDTAHEAVQALAARFPQESVRVQGELYSVKDLPADQLFARDVTTIATSPTGARGRSLLGDGEPSLVPLWQYRFTNPDPYKEPKPSTNDNRIVMMDGGVASAVMPNAGRYGSGTWVTFAGQDADGLPQALFLEHCRLRAADATNGLLAAQTELNDVPPAAKDQQPRVRISAVDFAVARPVFDGDRAYAVIGHQRATTQSTEPLKASELIAYDPVTLKPLWSSQKWLDGEAGLREVTFLAAPTVFGERLLLPSLRRSKYTLECIDRQTGRPLWNAQVHGGGTPFFKAPGCPVVVQGGIAYVATNAGCVASVDAFTGELRWIRRYERVDPLRRVGKTKRPTRNDEMAMYQQGLYRQEELAGFHPSDIVVLGGMLVVAPCDSDMLLCLDGATGQPQWMLDATTRYAVYGKLRSLVGLLGDDLIAVSDTHLVAIGASGGLVKWAKELPAWNGPRGSGRGRGAISGERVLIPGDREILVYDAAGAMQGRIALPAFDSSREPLAGPMHLQVHGAWLAIGYHGGVEMFSTAGSLRQLADGCSSVPRKADLLLRAGAHDEAMLALAAALRAARDATERRTIGLDLLAIVGERAAAVARQRDVAAALAVLDDYRELLSEPSVRLYWHLARVELCKERGDLLAHEREQNRLYAYMEGKG